MTSTTFHPLDPLTAPEILSASKACAEYHAKSATSVLRYNTITLLEPPKSTLLAFDALLSCSTNGHLPTYPVRQALVILEVPPFCGVIEVTVLLSAAPSSKEITGTVESWAVKTNVQAMFVPDDCFDAEDIAKADPTVIALLRDKYSVTDMSMVVCDPWSVHGPPLNGRLIQLFMYLRIGHEMDNAYAHPIGFVPIVDLYLKKIVRIDEPFGDSPAPKIPPLSVNYHRDLCEQPPRMDLRPLNITQPEGASWNITGNLIEWQKWNIRISFNYREGLVLHRVGYRDGGKVRPIIHRASLVEMAVPYGDPNDVYNRKCAFDVGDYGLGNCSSSLALGCDCLGNIHYFDAILNNTKGKPVHLSKAICMHEEDAGTLWKHVEYRNLHSEVRRSRRLVISFVTTVVNYEYAFYWYFYQDGTITYEIKLTGELSTNVLSPGEVSESLYGTMVARGVNSQYHQHLFSCRLDMAVDDAEGGKVSQCDIVRVGSAARNPGGNGFYVQQTPLLTEDDAQCLGDATKGRFFKITNPASLHPVTGKPVAWKILVHDTPLMLAEEDSLLMRRGMFATKSLWVTPHNEGEKWPAGDYTIQSEGGEGLSKWVANRPCGPGSDPVIWLTMAATHIPRVEDFPVMPCETVGFSLKPFCFFGGNPGVDVPSTANMTSTLAGNTCCVSST